MVPRFHHGSSHLPQTYMPRILPSDTALVSCTLGGTRTRKTWPWSIVALPPGHMITILPSILNAGTTIDQHPRPHAKLGEKSIKYDRTFQVLRTDSYVNDRAAALAFIWSSTSNPKWCCRRRCRECAEIIAAPNDDAALAMAAETPLHAVLRSLPTIFVLLRTSSHQQ